MNRRWISITALFLSLTLNGCGARQPEQAKTTPSVSHRVQPASPPAVSAEVVPRNYSEPLPPSEVTDLTVPGGMVNRYGYPVSPTDAAYSARPYTSSPNGFDDGAGSDALNLRNELMRTDRPVDASKKVSDPTIPSAIPSDEVSVNTDYSKPSTFSAASYGNPGPATGHYGNVIGASSSPVNDFRSLSSEDNPYINSNHRRSPQVSEPQNIQRHEVLQGETLYAISRKYGVSVRSIMDANNHLNNPNELYVGQVLTIPARK